MRAESKNFAPVELALRLFRSLVPQGWFLSGHNGMHFHPVARLQAEELCIELFIHAL